MVKMVIGTFGYCGSGQDTLADGLCDMKGFVKYSLGDVIRAEATLAGLPHTRENLQNIRMWLDETRGRDYVPRELAGRILSSEDERIVFTGIRRMEEYRIFHDTLGMKLIFVYADQDIRYQRMLRRGEAKDAATIEQLKRQLAREMELFDYDQLERVTDYRFDFNMPLEEYRAHMPQVLSRVLSDVFESECQHKEGEDHLCQS